MNGHWLDVRTPTSRKDGEKWGTPAVTDLNFFSNLAVKGFWRMFKHLMGKLLTAKIAKDAKENLLACVSFFLRRAVCFGRAPPASPVHQLARHDRFCHALLADIRNPLHPDSGSPGVFTPSFNFNFNPQLVSGNDGPPKTRPFDSGEHHQLTLTVWNLGQQQRSARLRNRLDDQNSGHDGQIRKVSGKKWLVDRHVLDCHNPLFAREINYPIDQQEWIPMGQDAQNILNVELDVLFRGRFGGNWRGLCHSGCVGENYTSSSHLPLIFEKTMAYGHKLRVP